MPVHIALRVEKCEMNSNAGIWRPVQLRHELTGDERVRLDSTIAPSRQFAALHTDVCFGRSQGKILWQPRIACWYTDKLYAGEPLPAAYDGMDMLDIYRSLGCSARLYQYGRCFKRLEHPSVKFIQSPLNETDSQTTIETPAGRQQQIIRRSPHCPAVYHLKWEVETEEELRVAIWREEHTTWAWDQDLYDCLRATTGDLGAPTAILPRMGIQSLYLEAMGIEKGIYALYEMTDTVEAYFRARANNISRLLEIVNASPIDMVTFGENIHVGTLSPDLFVKYHLPECQRHCEQLHAAGKFVAAHWDGDCRALLPLAKETGLDGIEAITPKPQGDVTLEEMKAGLGDQLFLLDGIPAVYFDKTFPVEELVTCTRRLIELFAPKLVLGISDEMSSSGDLERIRIVGEIVDAYNATRSLLP